MYKVFRKDINRKEEDNEKDKQDNEKIEDEKHKSEIQFYKSLYEKEKLEHNKTKQLLNVSTKNDGHTDEHNKTDHEGFVEVSLVCLSSDDNFEIDTKAKLISKVDENFQLEKFNEKKQDKAHRTGNTYDHRIHIDNNFKLHIFDNLRLRENDRLLFINDDCVISKEPEKIQQLARQMALAPIINFIIARGPMKNRKYLRVAGRLKILTKQNKDQRKAVVSVQRSTVLPVFDHGIKCIIPIQYSQNFSKWSYILKATNGLTLCINGNEFSMKKNPEIPCVLTIHEYIVVNNWKDSFNYKFGSRDTVPVWCFQIEDKLLCFDSVNKNLYLKEKELPELQYPITETDPSLLFKHSFGLKLKSFEFMEGKGNFLGRIGNNAEILGSLKVIDEIGLLNTDLVHFELIKI